MASRHEPTNQNSIKVTKVVDSMRTRIRKRYHKNLRTSVIESPMSMPSLINFHF